MPSRFFAAWVCALAHRGRAQDVRLTFKYPKDGTRVVSHVEPEFELWVDDHLAFTKEHGGAGQICCDLDGEALRCLGLNVTGYPLPQLQLGAHAIVCDLVGANSKTLLQPPIPTAVHFTVVATAAETNDGARLFDLKLRNDAAAEPLMQWWRGFAELPYESATPWVDFTVRAPLLAVGIKCAAGAVVARDAMRRTWLADAPEDGSLQARFIIGAVDDALLSAALRREHQVYGDLLLAPELNVPDSYVTLVEKTKGFARYVLGTMPDAVFVMLSDDDILVDVSRLLPTLRDSIPRRRFYAGQVWAAHFGMAKLPVRDPSHRNFLPEAAYPMSQLPPFAIGPHYFMSNDCAKFIAMNADDLAGIGTLEDVSVAFWLMAIGVHATHSEQFVNARTFGCRDDAVSTADLTPAGIFAMHLNWRDGRKPCAGFDELEWVKTPRFKFAYVT